MPLSRILSPESTEPLRLSVVWTDDDLRAWLSDQGLSAGPPPIAVAVAAGSFAALIAGGVAYFLTQNPGGAAMILAVIWLATSAGYLLWRRDSERRRFDERRFELNDWAWELDADSSWLTIRQRGAEQRFRWSRVQSITALKSGAIAIKLFDDASIHWLTPSTFAGRDAQRNCRNQLELWRAGQAKSLSIGELPGDTDWTVENSPDA